MKDLVNSRIDTTEVKRFKIIDEHFLVPEIPEPPNFIYKVKLREVPSPRLNQYFEPQVIVLDRSTLTNKMSLNPINYQYDDFQYPSEERLYWINFRTGEIIFNEQLAGELIKVKYYGTGSIFSVDDINVINNRFSVHPVINKIADSIPNSHRVVNITAKRIIELANITYKDNPAKLYEAQFGYFPDDNYPMSIIYNGIRNLDIVGIEDNKIYFIWDDTENIIKNKVLFNFSFTSCKNNVYCKILKHDMYNPIYIQLIYSQSDNSFKIYNRINNEYIGSTKPLNLFVHDNLKLELFIDVIDSDRLYDGDTIIFKSKFKGHTHDGIDSPRLSGYLDHTANLLNDFGNPIHLDLIKNLNALFLKDITFHNDLDYIIDKYNSHVETKDIRWDDIKYLNENFNQVLFNWNQSESYGIDSMIG